MQPAHSARSLLQAAAVTALMFTGSVHAQSSQAGSSEAPKRVEVGTMRFVLPGGETVTHHVYIEYQRVQLADGRVTVVPRYVRPVTTGTTTKTTGYEPIIITSSGVTTGSAPATTSSGNTGGGTTTGAGSNSGSSSSGSSSSSWGGPTGSNAASALQPSSSSGSNNTQPAPSSGQNTQQSSASGSSNQPAASGDQGTSAARITPLYGPMTPAQTKQWRDGVIVLPGNPSTPSKATSPTNTPANNTGSQGTTNNQNNAQGNNANSGSTPATNNTGSTSGQGNGAGDNTTTTPTTPSNSVNTVTGGSSSNDTTSPSAGNTSGSTSSSSGGSTTSSNNTSSSGSSTGGAGVQTFTNQPSTGTGDPSQTGSSSGMSTATNTTEPEPDPDNEPDVVQPVVDEAPTLVPGAGFAGPTTQPAAVGNPSQDGYDAKAIARWDVVPFQTFGSVFEIGVVAFHMNGIDRVEFSVDGGDWEPVYEMTLNPRTNVKEYWVRLDASLHNDGPVEVRAIAWPTVGEPRVLAGEYSWTSDVGTTQRSGEHSILLYANGSETLVEEIVELQPGNYTWGMSPFVGKQLDSRRWITFRAAPGVSPEDVVIDSTVYSQPSPDGSMQLQKVRFQNLTIEGPGILRYIASAKNPHEQIWFDGVTYRGQGQWEDSGVTESGVKWATNSRFSDLQLGPATGFVRNCEFHNFGEDVMRNVYFVVNVHVENVDRGPRTSWHSAVIGNPYTHDNRIYYGLVVKDCKQDIWAFRNGTHQVWENYDIAIVDCDTTRSHETGFMWYCGGVTEHLFVRNSRFVGRFGWRLSEDIPDYWQFQPKNVLFRDVIWQDDPSWVPSPPLAEVRIERSSQ